MSAQRILALYRLVFAVLIATGSLQTVLAGHHAGLTALGACELIAALALLWPRTRLPAAGVLLFIFALAQLHAALDHQWPTHLAQYAASTILIIALERTLERAPATQQRYDHA